MKDIKGFYIHVRLTYNSPIKNVMQIIPFPLALHPLLVSSSLIKRPRVASAGVYRVDSIKTRAPSQVSSLGT
jgi:hypothetical protein